MDYLEDIAPPSDIVDEEPPPPPAPDEVDDAAAAPDEPPPPPDAVVPPPPDEDVAPPPEPEAPPAPEDVPPPPEEPAQARPVSEGEAVKKVPTLKPSEARQRKKKRSRPKMCMECGVGKVCAKVQKKNEILWLCRTCCIEIQDLYDRYGTIHKGEAPPISIEDEPPDENLVATVNNIARVYEDRIGEKINQPLKNLRHHIDRCHAVCGVDDRGFPWDGFNYEFQYLENAASVVTQKLNFRAANHPANVPKNRYANVLPPETTRTILLTLNNQPFSDYINGNHLDGLAEGTKGRYMGVQGPLDNTEQDFWRLMWEQNSSVVVMVTREVEGQRVKCAQYWPEDESPSCTKRYGVFDVTLDDKTLENDIITRRFTIHNTEKDQSRPLIHYQYIEWPDHGVPSGGQIFLGLVAAVDQTNPTNGPVTVHCSAGIGRTGTFCVVHAVLEKYRQDLAKGIEEPEVNILDTILHFRRQRPGMVQTKDQMVFCYNAVLEWIERQGPQVRELYALADFEPTEFDRIEEEQSYMLDIRKGEKLTVVHMRDDGWCKAINQWGDVGYVPIYYLDPFRHQQDYPNDEPLPSLDNPLPESSRLDVRPRQPEPQGPTEAEKRAAAVAAQRAQQRAQAAAPARAGQTGAVPQNETAAQRLERHKSYLSSELRVADTATAFIMAERIIGTWKANKTQMNQDEPRTALMSNVKQMRADGTYTNLIMDNVAEGRYRIEDMGNKKFRLVTVEKSKKIVEELDIEVLDGDNLVVANQDDPDFAIRIFYLRTEATGEMKLEQVERKKQRRREKKEARRAGGTLPHQPAQPQPAAQLPPPVQASPDVPPPAELPPPVDNMPPPPVDDMPPPPAAAPVEQPRPARAAPANNGGQFASRTMPRRPVDQLAPQGPARASDDLSMRGGRGRGRGGPGRGDFRGRVRGRGRGVPPGRGRGGPARGGPGRAPGRGRGGVQLHPASGRPLPAANLRSPSRVAGEDDLPPPPPPAE